MHEHQNKGVVGKAFCKLLNEKEMDDGRFRYRWFVKRRRGRDWEWEIGGKGTGGGAWTGRNIWLGGCTPCFL
jgi:hypothetical protein